MTEFFALIHFFLLNITGDSYGAIRIWSGVRTAAHKGHPQDNVDPVLHGVGMPGGGISTTEAAEEVEVLAMGMELTSRALIRRGRRRPRTLLGHTKAVTRLVFRPSDGAFICSCARDSTLRLWHVRHRRHHESYQGSCFLPILSWVWRKQPQQY